MTEIKGQQFDEERALYGSDSVRVVECSFDGPADGESAFKECQDIEVKDCYFNLRYPFWHDTKALIEGCEMTSGCRAALWYSTDVTICNTKMHGIKALRECGDICIKDCDIISPEFGWSVSGIKMERSHAEGEYFMMRSTDLVFDEVSLKGKYSFQYIENGSFTNCNFDTKDAFWHGKNIVVKDSVLKGEYLAWYSENLTLIHCKIIGTQPFCYCKNLKLIDCEMIDTDLCFEKSSVEATIHSYVMSIKNPKEGKICVAALGELIMDDPTAKGVVEVNPNM